ncbi:hypothetical protein ACSIGC_07035 [Tenacibaculum sp. ZS6-P6]|uniref:hypothetical protein n=1 Tax=Tenacibaculum sp. ZS6-P6 TaxID=3447503 RepID=UPI003F9E70C2
MKKIEKHIKFLISFLLIFSLTVTECSSISTPNNNPSYFQISFAKKQKKLTYEYAKYNTNNKQLLVDYFLEKFLIYLNFKEIHNFSTKKILDVQHFEFLKISHAIYKQTFLIKKFISNHQISSLYIA